MVPKTQYAKSGDVRIAYQVVGEGPFDLVFVPGFISNLDVAWEEPYRARVWTRLAAFARLIMFDKRGTGLSDRTVGAPTLEERMDDVRAVMDAVGSQQAALFGISEGGAMSLLFAGHLPGTYPCAGPLRRLWPFQLVGCATGQDRCRPGSHGKKLGDRREPPFVRPQCGIR
jgi:pimeloyl-ACP methyl ester carboxylesterase